MKQTLIIVFALCLASSAAMAQGSLAKGKAQINAGLGLSTWGVPVYVGFDAGIHEDITIGGRLSFRSYNERIYNDRYRQTLFAIGANGNYHFNRLLDLPSEFDLYAGATLGYYIWSDGRWDGNPGVTYTGRASTLYGEIQVGGRYFFNEKFGLNAELGGGALAGASFGVTIKL